MAHRPNILALASKISLESLTYTGITYGDPEYRILDPIVDDDMCSVMMRMRLETDFSAEDLAKKTRKSLDFVQTQCDKLVKAGVIRTRVRSGVLCYYYPIWVPGPYARQRREFHARYASYERHRKRHAQSLL